MNSVATPLPPPFDLSSMLCAGGQNINSRGINSAAAQNAGQLGDILVQGIKASGKAFPLLVQHQSKLRLLWCELLRSASCFYLLALSNGTLLPGCHYL